MDSLQGRLWIVKAAFLMAVLGLSVGLAQTAEELTNPAPGDWPTYGRTLQMTRYSPLTQITPDNVGNLRLAWSRSLSTVFTAEGSAIEYKGILYVSSPDQIWAFDATNGDQVWTQKVKLDKNASGTTMRGSPLVYQGKVFWTAGDGRLIAMDAKTGDQAWSTQVGQIQYSEGFTAGPIFADGKVIVGPAGGDAGGVPGRVVALDASSGEILWTFHNVPQPGEPAFDTWDPPSTAQWGGGSSWNSGAYDPETKTVIYGVGNATPWFRPGSTSKDLYTGSWVGIDVQTGKLKWYFQVAPHDEWDADQIATPTIVDVTIKGTQRHVALLPSVNGFLIQVDLNTGKYIDSFKKMPKTTFVEGFQSDGTPIIDSSFYFTKEGDTRLVCGFRWVDFEPAAYSPDTGLYYRPNNDSCWNVTAKSLPNDWKPGDSAIGDTYTQNPDMFDRLGAISAIDPATGKTVWEFTTPYAQYMGPVATKGGLVFAGFADRHFRAFDAKTGDVLWEQVLPAAIMGNPISYEVNGVQYVATLDGGSLSIASSHQSSVPDEVSGDVGLFVFALPGANQ